MPPKYPAPDFEPRPGFAFCRGHYDPVRYEPLGQSWYTDYPDSDFNLSLRLSELTRTPIRKDHYGDPDHVVVRLTDENLFEHPLLFMSDVGTIGLSLDEVEALREYLLRGGMLYVDDFWGYEAWRHWETQIGRVLPPGDYPIVELPRDHYLFRIFYQVDNVPQIPSIQYWYRSGGGTSERGAESARATMRAIFDPEGRLLVLMSHNTDIADGWEREGDSEEFFDLFSIQAYPIGINIVLYALLG